MSGAAFVDSLHAEGDAITLSGTEFVFCVTSNTSPSPPAQTLTVIPTKSAVIYVASASPSWIRLNGAGPGQSVIGNTATSPTLGIQIDPSGYATGTTAEGFIQVASGQTVLTAKVTVNVSASCSSALPLRATPAFISLTQATVSQTLTISGGSAGSAVTASANYGNGPTGWFGLSANSFTTVPLTLTVSSNVSSSNAAYSGTITFTQNGSSPLTVAVSFAPGGAGNGAFTATPSTISQSFPTTGAGAVTQLVAIGARTLTGVQLTATVDPGTGPAGWIALAAPPGAVPTSATVVIDPSNLTTGATYNGSVTFADAANSANFIAVPVTATVGVSGAYSSSASPINFSIPAGSSSLSQQVTISGPATAQIAALAQLGNGPSGWLSVSPATTTISASGAAALTVSVNALSLIPGLVYTGSIVITQNATTVLVVPVNAIVGGSASLTVTPSQLNFAYQLGTAAPPVQTLNVTSPLGTQITFQASASTSNCGNWLSVSPSQPTTVAGTTPTPITVSLNTASLTAAGSCSGTIAITASGASTPSVTIPVSLAVSANPVLTASPSSISFTYQSGGAVPAAQSVSVASSSAGLNFTVSAVPAGGAPNFLVLNPSTGTTPGNLSVGLISSVVGSLAPGTYVENVFLGAPNSGNGTVIVPVILTIPSTAMLIANPASLALNYQIGQAAPSAQTITISSSGVAMAFSASATSSNCSNVFSVFPASGVAVPGIGQTGGQISVSVNVTGLTLPTTCSGTITITSSAPNGPLTIPVTLNVVNAPVISVGKTNITQAANVGSSGLITVQVPLVSSDNSTSIGYSAAAAGQGWLSVFPQTGSTPTTLFVQLNAAGLLAGIYTGIVTVTDSRSGSPVPVQIIPVTLVVSAQASVSPDSLKFVLPQGGTAPSQTITVNNVLSGTTLSASTATFQCGSNWITSSVTGNTVGVAINGTGITTAMSPCMGQVSIVVPGASNSPISIPVLLTVTPAINLGVSPSDVSFRFTVGSGETPQNQTVQLTASNNSVVPYSAVISAQSASNLFTISPSSGNIPGLLTIGVNPAVLATLAAGTASGTITVSSPNLVSVTINVSVTTSVQGAPVITTVVNAASQRAGALSPGELVTIYGTNLGPSNPLSLALTSSGMVSSNLGNTQVLFDSVPAPLLYVSPTQANVIVPYEISGRAQTTLTVVRPGAVSNAVQFRAGDTSLAIFTMDASGQGQGAILNQDGTVNGPAAPAPKLSTISIFATGEGQLNPPGLTGSITSTRISPPKPLAGPFTVALRITAADGTKVDIPAVVTYAGEAPGLVSGVLQVNAIIPDGVPSGRQAIVLGAGSDSTPPLVFMYVQ